MPKFNITKVRVSGKHDLIDKANLTIVIAVSGAIALVVFTLVASNALIKQAQYQNKVIGLLSTASADLEDNLAAANDLKDAYTTFDSAAESVIGTPDKNSKIVLDALPSKYDFPALATSMDALIKGSGVSKGTVTGSDNELTAEQSSSNPVPVEIPLSFGTTGGYKETQKLVADIERSIRPIVIASISFEGSDSSLQTSIVSTTYYQPSKLYDVKFEKVAK